MTKRQADKLHELRRALIAVSWQTRLARKHGNIAVETEASLEREITLCQIRNAKNGIR
jgi:hypothetical protein